ncbi:MAG: hypothetical protein M3Y80_04015 [Verrucomicrobiota bacterium]|nr:hypothetical protein [Verrucomicrobiota bacterium]
MLATPVLAQRQLTAYDALKTVGTQLSRSYLSRVVSVTGVEGDPQPQAWRIIVADRTLPAGAREIMVRDGQVVANGPPSGAIGGSLASPISTARLNLDSNGAFAIANHTADTSHTNFARVNYTLRSSEHGFPVWIVTLQDDNGQALGTIHISAAKGNITRVEGMYAGAKMTTVEQDPVQRGGRSDSRATASPEEPPVSEDGDESDENPIKTEIKRMFRRTKRDAAQMFNRVSRRFEDYYPYRR